MRLIDKSAVLAEIEKLEKLYCYGKSDGMLIAKSVFDSIKNIINTLEVKEIPHKFKEGEWIVIDGETLQIESIGDKAYNIKDGGIIPFRLEHEIHLWTIEDAKDGDIVYDKSDGTIGIFKQLGCHPDSASIVDDSYCDLHCNCDGEFFWADFERGNEINTIDTIPATKEQRDQLFKAMHDAGYKWDAEKKELKKIEEPKQESNNEELTEFEQAIYNELDKWNGDWCDELEDETKDFAKELLSIARKQFVEEACCAYCKVCDTQECGGTFECCWVNKFRKALEK